MRDIVTQNSSPAADFLTRLDAVLSRFAIQASRTDVSGFTDADPTTGERWNAGQVWAHLTEFIPYWLHEARKVVNAGAQAEPIGFGRTKTDPERIKAIEDGRHRPIAEQMSRLRSHVKELRAWLRSLPTTAWSIRGTHPTLGTMTVSQIVDEFLVGHLEEHAEQLERLQ